MIRLTVTEYLCHKWPRLCSVCRNHIPVLFSSMIYHRVCNKDVRRVLQAEYELLFKAPEFIPVFGGFRDAWSLALCAIFVDRCLSFCPVNVGHVLAFSFTIEYLQTFLTDKIYLRSFTHEGRETPNCSDDKHWLHWYISIYLYIYNRSLYWYT